MIKDFLLAHLPKIEFSRESEDNLSTDFDVTIWNEKVWDSSVFKINQNFLSDLLKATLQFDYGILLGTNDDEVEFRGQVMLQQETMFYSNLGYYRTTWHFQMCLYYRQRH